MSALKLQQKLQELQQQQAVIAAQREGKVLPEALQRKKSEPHCSICHMVKRRGNGVKHGKDHCEECKLEPNKCQYTAGHKKELMIAKQISTTEVKMNEKKEKEDAAAKMRAFKDQTKIGGPTPFQNALLGMIPESNVGSPLLMQSLVATARKEKSQSKPSGGKIPTKMNELLDKVASQGGGGASTAAAIRAGMSAHVDRNIAPKKRKVDQTADGASGAGGGTTRIRSVKDTADLLLNQYGQAGLMEILVLMSQKVTDAENDYAASAADDSEDNDSATAGGGSDATAVDADCDDSTVANVNCDDAGSADGSFGAGGGTDYSLYDTSSQSDCEDMTSQLSTARVMSPMKAVAAAPAAARKHAPAGASVSASAARAARKLAPAAAAAAPKAAAAVVAAAAAAAAPKPAATAAAAAAQAPQPAAAAAAAAVAVAVAAPAADKENAPPTNDNHHPNRRILSRSTALPAGFGGGMTALGRTRPMQRPESVVMPPPVSVPTAVFVVPAPVTPTVIPTPTAPVFDKSASFSVPGGATNAIPRPAIPQYAATGEVRRETLSQRATQELANNIYAAQQSLNEQGIGGSGALLQYLPKKNQIYEYPVFAPVQVPVTLTAHAAPAAPAPAESNRSYTTPPTQYSSGVGTYPAPGTVYAPQPAVTAYTNTSHYAPVQVYPHHAPPAVTAAVTAGSSMYHSRHHKNSNSTASSTSYGYTGGMPVARYPPHRPNYAARIDAHTYGPATPHVFPASFQ